MRAKRQNSADQFMKNWISSIKTLPLSAPEFQGSREKEMPAMFDQSLTFSNSENDRTTYFQ